MSRADATLSIANAIRQSRYPEAAVVLAAGSIFRGESTPHSDLDLVVIYEHLPCAYREAFQFQNTPIEAFVHDRDTLEYFFVAVDAVTGVPALLRMVLEGIEVPGANDISRTIKERAAALLEQGPPKLDGATEARTRYVICNLLDDLRDERADGEILGIGGQLYEQLANYYLRLNGLWSAKGKHVTRALSDADPNLGARYADCFRRLYTEGDAADVIRLAEELLEPAGGVLFDGFKQEAPAAWRKAPPASEKQDNEA